MVPSGSVVAVAGGGDDEQIGRLAHSVGVYLLLQAEQGLSGFLNPLLAAQLGLDRDPPSVAGLDDGVGLQVVAVAVVIDVSIVGLPVDAKVAHH